MGMTIDKAIAKIWHCIVSIRDCVGNKEFVEALELSVDTMRKYQKIQKILRDDTYYEEYGNNAEDFIVSAISEVVEDGKHDET